MTTRPATCPINDPMIYTFTKTWTVLIGRDLWKPVTIIYEFHQDGAEVQKATPLHHLAKVYLSFFVFDLLSWPQHMHASCRKSNFAKFVSMLVAGPSPLKHDDACGCSLKCMLPWNLNGFDCIPSIAVHHVQRVAMFAWSVFLIYWFPKIIFLYLQNQPPISWQFVQIACGKLC